MKSNPSKDPTDSRVAAAQFVPGRRGTSAHSTTSATRIGALLTCHNRRELTLECLRSFFESALAAGVDAHAYLVDDGCTDGTADAVARRFGASLTVLPGSGSLYWTGGMICAADAALANGEEMLLMLNDDVVLAPGAIARLLEDRENAILRGFPGTVVIAGGLVDGKSGAPTYGGVIRSSRVNPLRLRVAASCGVPFACASLNGNVALIPSESWRVVGGLDPRFPHRAADFDFGLRLRRAGIRILQSSEAVGCCARNPFKAGHEPSAPLSLRFRRAFGVKGTPPAAMCSYVRRHGGIWWFPLLSMEFLGTLLGILRAHFSSGRTRVTRGAPLRHVLYCVDFVPEATSGKHRATVHKRDALTRVGVDVRLSHPGSSSGVARLRGMLAAEIRGSIAVASMPRGCSALMARGACGFLPQVVAALRGMTTVREIHGIAREEVRLLGRPAWWRAAHAPIFWLSSAFDSLANVRIYNNPRLLEALEDPRATGVALVVPNGCDPSSECSVSREDARRTFELPLDRYVLAFVGSASPWHAVQLLVALQNAFDVLGLPVSVIAGGGPVPGMPPSGRSISPLDSAHCGLLIRAADACLLPSGDRRKSPGSPLKLYDYLLNGRPVIVQSELPGYQEEVVPRGVGIEVDFRDPPDAARRIYRYLEKLDREGLEVRCRTLALHDYSWDARIRVWIRTTRIASP